MLLPPHLNLRNYKQMASVAGIPSTALTKLISVTSVFFINTMRAKRYYFYFISNSRTEFGLKPAFAASRFLSFQISTSTRENEEQFTLIHFHSMLMFWWQREGENTLNWKSVFTKKIMFQHFKTIYNVDLLHAGIINQVTELTSF